MSRAIVLAAALCVAMPEGSRGADHAPAPPAKTAPPASSAHPTAAALPMNLAAPARLMRDVRALEDRMAQGDEQAFRRRVELIRGAAVSLRAMPTNVWSESRNWRALLAYALGGGDVRLVKDLSAKGELKEVEKGLLKGVIALAEAREDDALKELAQIEVAELDIGLSAPLALAMAPHLAPQNWQRAKDILEDVVLRAPGTLMEESALRRLTILHLAHGDPAQAFAVFSRHVRRFPQSIFAGQARKSFAAELVARPDERATGSLVEAGLRFMAHDAATRFCLEIAEGGLRKGRLELARSAASEAAKRSAMTGPDASTQIRATLYRTVAEVPTAPASETLKALEALKREELTPSDRHLVSVAEQLARAIGNDASPTPAAAAVAASSPEDQLKRARSLLSASTVVLAKGPK